MKIPDDIYYRVFELATALVNSVESFDTRANLAQYNELRDLCEAEAASGRSHPFLYETLADFTDDDGVAIDLYMKGLASATAPEAVAYRASIQLAIAERYKSMGQDGSAYRHALLADEAARTLDDLDLRRSISEFLMSVSKLA